MNDDIIKRLESFGYTFDDSDLWVLGFLSEKVENTIKNECNVTAVPDGLHNVAVDMVCGEFLAMKKGSCQLDGFNVDLNETALKQVSEGDTSVTFAIDQSMSAEKRLESLIYSLINSGKDQFITYRRIKWT